MQQQTLKSILSLCERKGTWNPEEVKYLCQKFWC